jgi:hypothetical protein
MLVMLVLILHLLVMEDSKIDSAHQLMSACVMEYPSATGLFVAAFMTRM